ncbi:E3 ubiquitin-protein ligase TTC3 isoform 2-T2 [Aulostomus maculatus]
MSRLFYSSRDSEKMSDSDSSDYSDCEDIERRMGFAGLLKRGTTEFTYHPAEEFFERWSRISVDVKMEAGQLMRVSSFWVPVLLRQEGTNSTSEWAVEIGLLNPNDTSAITLKHLHKIEILEAILRAMEKGILKVDQTKHVFWLSNRFNVRSPEVLEDALDWLERTGEPLIRSRILELGHTCTCFKALHLIFTEFAHYIHEMGTNLEETMKALTAQPHELLQLKSEAIKRKGNENFQKKRYKEAVSYYTEATFIHPENHKIYGNRALCYIRCNEYLEAVVDGKRAMLIKPFWAKGHYRYCEALFLLGEVKMAVEANISARNLCKNDSEGLRDLEQQHQRFVTQMGEDRKKKENAAKAGQSKKSQNSRPDASNNPDVITQPQSEKVDKVKPATNTVTQSKSQPQSGKVNKTNAATSSAPQDKVSGTKTAHQNQPVKKEKTAEAKGGTRDSKTAAKKKAKGRKNPPDEETATKNITSVSQELRSMVGDAHAALADLRSRNAEQAFGQALALLDTRKPEELGLSNLDVQLLLYGRASALTDIGQTEGLAEAQRLLEKIKSFEERLFQCLVYYGIGRIYLKENRFARALEHFSDSLQMIMNQITPGKLTWPLTKEIVKETQPEYFRELLDSAIVMCKFPPLPDAVCRLQKCLGPLKAEIYLTDPDFKGFIQMRCCQSCIVEYHISCWKTLKSSSFLEKNEKEFLEDACLTPDCVGQICSIKIFSPTGLVKCKFETTISRQEMPKKPKVNQTCTSLKKLKSKAEHRLKRKQHKVAHQNRLNISDEALREKDAAAAAAVQSPPKAWLVYTDRVLLQISQHLELLREESGLCVSTLTGSLKPWLELDSSRGNPIAGRMLNWQQEQLETLSQAVELLLERKNRVWARILVHVLSNCPNIHSKLKKWACQLNDAGLNAAKSFIECNSEHLEQLDLAVLLSFGPLQEMVIEKLDTTPELLSSIGLTVTEYLKQAPSHDMRLFIWTLEEHRDIYVSCHTILDNYFDMLEGHCSVLRKSDENSDSSPMKSKSRGRKKKGKELKGDVWPRVRGLPPRDESDQEFFEDDTLSFLDPGDPFSVPSHLREQVADFEDQYNWARSRDRLKKILDNNPDPTKESLYDYFAQILEEHGPMFPEDPLLVGEIQNFPREAQRKIQEVGGFEPFLLNSLRFIKMGNRIGLAKHAVSLQEAEQGAHLDDLDDFFDSDTDSLFHDFPSDIKPSFTSSLDSNSSTQTEACPVPPSALNPPVTRGPLAGDQLSPPWSNGDAYDGHQQQFIPYECEGLDLYTCEVEGVVWDIDPYLSGFVSMSPEENLLKKHAAAQTCPEIRGSVAMNTEPHERFERSPGDINKKEKSNKEMEEQINKMENGGDKVGLRHKEATTSLEEEIEMIRVNVQVTNKELALFQQKLEEEVKKDQKEKKSNQEVLKSLKQEREELLEEQASLTRRIRESKSSYDEKLRDFLELSNQSAAEKMSLEEEIERWRTLMSTMSRRSHTAQLSVVGSRRDQDLYGLRRELAGAKALLTKVDEAVHKFPVLESTRNSLRTNVKEAEKKISSAEAQYKQQMEEVRNGRRVSELVPVHSAGQPEPPAEALFGASKEVFPQPAVQRAAAAEAAAAPTQYRPAVRQLEAAHGTVFEKAMEHLTAIFPDYTRADLMTFVKELRSSSGGHLGNMVLTDVVSGVTQLILDHQERLSSGARPNLTGRGRTATPPLLNPAPVWQQLGPHRATNSGALNMEDPCVICHEEMSADNIHVLECRHGFHKECIMSWLKEQRTCPTCRDHALMPDDFPSLPGRRRQAP